MRRCALVTVVLVSVATIADLLTGAQCLRAALAMGRVVMRPSEG